MDWHIVFFHRVGLSIGFSKLEFLRLHPVVRAFSSNRLRRPSPFRLRCLSRRERVRGRELQRSSRHDLGCSAVVSSISLCLDGERLYG